MMSGESLMSRVTDSVAAWCGLEESVTVSVKEKVPAFIGVPSSCPAGLSDKPGGNVPVSLHANGPMPPVGAAKVNAGYTISVMPVGGGGALGLKVSRADAPPSPHAASCRTKRPPRCPRAILRRTSLHLLGTWIHHPWDLAPSMCLDVAGTDRKMSFPRAGVP